MTRPFFLLLLILLHYSPGIAQSASPASPSSGKGMVREGTIRLPNAEREFLLYLPENYAPKKTYPLVLNFHGLSGDMRQQMNYTRFNRLADRHNFIVVYPQGLVAEVPGMGKNTQWDTYFFTDTRDVQFIDSLIRRLEADYSIDPRRIYATGFSNGAFMSYRLACELPGRLAAIAPVGGNLPLLQSQACPAEQPISMLYIHGTADKVVPEGGIPMYSMSAEATLEFFVEKNACREDPYVFDLPDVDPTDESVVKIITYADCEGKAMVEHYRVLDGGHTWPGAQKTRRLGVTNRDFDASEVIWEFFSRHRLPRRRDR